MNSFDELKPCPFCLDGGKPVILEENFRFDGEDHKSYNAYCQECETEGKWGRTREEAVEAWNTRHERTCTIDYYEHCSVCGENTQEILYWVSLDNGLRTVKGHKPNYCGNCGAKVINNE